MDVFFEVFENPLLSPSLFLTPNAIRDVPAARGHHVRFRTNEDVLRRFKLKPALWVVAGAAQHPITILDTQLADPAAVFGNTGNNLQFLPVEHESDVLHKI